MTTDRSGDERERREVATGADAAPKRDDRDEVELEQLEQRLQDDRADGAVTCAGQPRTCEQRRTADERLDADEDGAADDVRGHDRGGARGIEVAGRHTTQLVLEERELEVEELICARVRRAAEAGRDAVDGLHRMSDDGTSRDGPGADATGGT